jgi:hypothetical protein
LLMECRSARSYVVTAECKVANKSNIVVKGDGSSTTRIIMAAGLEKGHVFKFWSR